MPVGISYFSYLEIYLFRVFRKYRDSRLSPGGRSRIQKAEGGCIYTRKFSISSHQLRQRRSDPADGHQQTLSFLPTKTTWTWINPLSLVYEILTPISLTMMNFKPLLLDHGKPSFTKQKSYLLKNWPRRVRAPIFSIAFSNITFLVAAERVKEEEEENEIAMRRENPEIQEEAGLTFDETSEFVQAVGNNPIVKPKREPKEPSLTQVSEHIERETTDVPMAPGDVALDELEAGEVRVKDEDEDIDMAMLDDIELALKATEAEEKAALDTATDGVGTSSEQNFSSGMASTLTLLRQQGILAQPSADQMDREKTQRQRDLWLAEQRRRVAQKELEKYQSRGGNKDQAQREYENRLREQQEARDNMEAFKNYKPDVNIVYYDEFGRALTPKEAWKALSHKFHGKGSGKMKTEKKLKKIAEEQKREAMVSGDTPLSMNRAFQQRQEKTGQAHFVLSVGNRGSATSLFLFFVCHTNVCSPLALFPKLPTSWMPNHWLKARRRRQRRRKKVRMLTVERLAS